MSLATVSTVGGLGKKCPLIPTRLNERSRGGPGWYRCAGQGRSVVDGII